MYLYVFIYTDFCRSFPVAYFTLPKAAVVVRFNPVRYCLRPAFPPQSSLFSLPYRFLFAVGTREGVLIFDTQQSHPVCRLSNLHYAGITDLTWYLLFIFNFYFNINHLLLSFLQVHGWSNVAHVFVRWFLFHGLL